MVLWSIPSGSSSKLAAIVHWSGSLDTLAPDAALDAVPPVDDRPAPPSPPADDAAPEEDPQEGTQEDPEDPTATRPDAPRDSRRCYSEPADI